MECSNFFVQRHYYGDIFSDSVVSQLGGLSGASHACARSCRSGMGSAWSIHSSETFRVQSPAAENLRRFSCCDVRRTCSHPAEPPRPPAEVRTFLLPRHQECCHQKMVHCRMCYADLLFEQRLNQSAPSIHSPIGFGKKRRFQKSSLLP